MSHRWFGLPYLMVVIVLLATCLAAMKTAGPWLTQGLMLAVFLGLMVATLGAIVRRPRRSVWVGVSLFAWGYLGLIVAPPTIRSVASFDNDPESYWQVDGLVRPLASRMFRDLPEPIDPFPNVSIVIDPASGRWVKSNNRQFSPMTPEETKLQVDYDARNNLYLARVAAAHRSRMIGLTIQGVVFAMIGGVVGHALSDRTPTSTPG